MTDEELFFKISGGLIRLRRNAGFKSAVNFANVVGMNRTCYHRAESGKNMNLKTLNKILLAHNLTFKEFCERELT